jgi:capsule polysaccharide export protein KpsE/RkpR
MAQAGTKQQPETMPQEVEREALDPEVSVASMRENLIQRLRLLWNERRFLSRAAVAGLLLGTLVAFLLPKRFESTTQLMPPDSQSTSGMAMLAALTAKTGSGVGAVAGDLLGIKSSGALFIGILRSGTVEDRLVERFGLKKVYGKRLDTDARQKLAENTAISEDRKSGILTISVTDGDRLRAAAIARAYVEELDRLVAELSTSSAHRERVFLEERLTAVKQELDQASKEFSQFASKNITIDIKEQGKAMVDAAATLMGELIAAESELKGLEQIYTPNNVRVRSVQARITELRKQLEKMGGKEGTETNSAAAGGDSMYPSIRKLPLLGVTYADLYRRTRIQEAVYETLTQEYELAKVQEAKETPSVKVLDVARIPERKSFPPRLLIMFLCTFLALTGASVLALGKARWEEVDAQDPGKVFAKEVFQTMNAGMPWATPNGSRLQAVTHRVWMRLARRDDSGTQVEDSQNRQ